MTSNESTRSRPGPSGAASQCPLTCASRPPASAIKHSGAVDPTVRGWLRVKQAFSKLYGYTSDEQGIRHALIDNPQANVGQDEAIFMLGACASFSSYLARKHRRSAS